jgi:hypothetical protein
LLEANVAGSLLVGVIPGRLGVNASSMASATTSVPINSNEERKRHRHHRSSRFHFTSGFPSGANVTVISQSRPRSVIVPSGRRDR